MKLLVTGCAGFIGSAVCALALKLGYDVVGVDNFNDYYSVKLKHWRVSNLNELTEIAGNKFECVNTDIENSQELEALFAKHKFYAVINLAARAGVRASIEKPKVYYTTNVLGMLNILEACKNHKVNKCVLASTSSLYAGQEMPFVETAHVNEPISPYAASKKAAEVLCYTYSRLYQIDISIVRYFTVYGPAGRPDMSPLKFCHCIYNQIELPLYGDGTYSRDFTYISDIARGTLLSLNSKGYKIFNLGCGGSPVTINEMISLLARYMDKRPIIKYLPFNSSDVDHTMADTNRAKLELGWQAEVNPNQGFSHLVEWYIQNQDLMHSVYSH